MIEAIIFDMDGLLIDSEPVWDEARAALALDYGQTWTLDDQLSVMGVSTSTWVNYMLLRLKLDLSPQALQDAIAERMLALYTKRIPFKPYAIEAINMASQNFKTGLASGSIRVLIDSVTSDKAIKGKLQEILSADEVAKGKPAPDVYLEVAKRLGVKAQHCLCLEDSNSGILAGLNANMQVIAVPDPHFPVKPELLERCVAVLSSLKDFNLALVSKLSATS